MKSMQIRVSLIAAQLLAFGLTFVLLCPKCRIYILITPHLGYYDGAIASHF